jgi:methyl-accepting chemotaxis protein
MRAAKFVALETWPKSAARYDGADVEVRTAETSGMMKGRLADMSKLRVGPLVGGMVLIPCLVASVLALEWARARGRSSEEAHALDRMGQLAVVIGDLLHETQKERGASSVYLSSRGARFTEQLKAQHLLTDQVRIRFVELLEAERTYWPPHVVATLELANGSLRDIESRRRQIFMQEISPTEEMAYYTELDDRLLESIGSLVENTADVALRGTATAYLFFLHAKEKTGLERAQLANVFGTDSFASGQLAVVAGLIASQNAYLTVFAKLAPPALLHGYAMQMNAPAALEVRRMEQIALGRSSGFGIDSAAWFTAMSKKIELMKGVEDTLSDALRSGARLISDGARASLFGAIVLAVFMLGGGLAGTLALSVSILRPLGRLRQAVDRVTEGDSTVTIVLGGPVEIRDLAEAFRRMMESLRWARASTSRPPTGGGTRVIGSRFNVRP